MDNVESIPSLETAEDVLKAIFTHDYIPAPWTAPKIEDIAFFAELVAKNGSEEEFQIFFGNFPSIIIGAVHYGRYDSVLGFLYKPSIGKLFADFGVVVITQGGCQIHLIEIEKPHSELFNRKGQISGDLRSAENQVREWDLIIQSDKKSFAKSILEQICSAPLFGDHNAKSFRTSSIKATRNGWDGFGGNEHTYVGYLVVCGRWSKLAEQEQAKIFAMNTSEKRLYKLCTYEQLARDAFVNLYTEPTF